MTLLSVSHLSKKFAHQFRRALWYGLCDAAAELRMRPDQGLRAGEFWALQDVSFELAPGEALAIVGGNGAGKSTLLKLLFGLLKPDGGEVRVRGSVAAMIELGTGLHPLLTGRENVRLGASLNGLSMHAGADLQERMIDFADIGSFIDAPVQSYSAGMRARLGFALATQLEPAVMLVDEVLAVGDLAFQHKCALYLRGYLDRGGSLILVSHNVHQVQALCERGLLLDHGRAVFSGTAVNAVDRMFELLRTEEQGSQPRHRTYGPLVIEGLVAAPVLGDEIRNSMPVRITLAYRAEVPVEVLWGISIWSGDHWVCIAGEHDPVPRALVSGAGELTCTIARLPLVSGRYSLRAAILDRATRQPLAMFGWGGGGSVLDVRSSPSDVENARRANGHLVTLDVDWR